MSARRFPPQPGDGAFGAGWLLTFADLVALLLCFFVMIYATQKTGEGDWQAMAESLSRSLSPAREAEADRRSAERNVSLVTQAPALDLGYLEALLKGVIAQEPSLAGVTLHRLDDRLAIALPDELLFAPGSATPIAAAAGGVAALATVLRNVGNRVDVFGHTDPDPVRGDRFATNWDLSLARALAVAAMLGDAGYGRRMAAYGLADSRFRELDGVEPPERRYRLARRVDIVIRPSAERF